MDRSKAGRAARAVLLALAAAPLFAQSTPAEGAATFERYCASCHGHDARGGRGPDLTAGARSDAAISRVVSRGIPAQGMPAFADELKEAELQQLIGYLRSLRPAVGEIAAAGNAGRGREIFWGQGGCGNCHMVAGRGGRLGPELTRIGAQRGLAYLKESITDPSADVDDAYSGVRVVPRSGRPVTGIRKNEDNFTIQIFDTAEKFRSFRKPELVKVEDLDESLMPRSSLGAGEVDDVVAYLSTLRGAN